MSADRHPGITMHKLPVGGGFVGLLFAVGSAVIFVLGFPTLWYFVAFAFVLGIGVAVFLRLIGTRRSDRSRPLSILAATRPAHDAHPRRQKRHRMFQVMPKPTAA